MADCFLKEDATKLMHNKYVVFIGSSIIRSMYKDFVKLLQGNALLSDAELRMKGKKCIFGDELLEGGVKMELTNGTQYKEVRQFNTDFVLVRFYFITRCYNNYVEAVIKEMSREHKPDLVIMNSGLWDLTRYGPNPVEAFKKNLNIVFTRLTRTLPAKCLVLWVTCMPISSSAKGGVFVPEVEHLRNLTRLELLQANSYSAEVAKSFKFDVLDLGFFMRNQLHRIAEDGIHWDMTAHRRFTNLLMSHVSEAWGVALPGRAVANDKPEEKQQVKVTKEERKIKPIKRRLRKINRESETKASISTKDSAQIKVTVMQQNANRKTGEAENVQLKEAPVQFVSSENLKRALSTNKGRLVAPKPISLTIKRTEPPMLPGNTCVSVKQAALSVVDDVMEALHSRGDFERESFLDNIRDRQKIMVSQESAFIPINTEQRNKENGGHSQVGGELNTADEYRSVWVQDYSR